MGCGGGCPCLPLSPAHLPTFWTHSCVCPQVLAAHKCGLRPAVGYELNPWLVGLARLHAWRAGCAGSVCYLREDLWKVTQGVPDPQEPPRQVSTLPALGWPPC